MRIALIDPSRTTRLIVARMLEAGGHEVVPFADEREALAQITADPGIEALITSAELKNMSGVELCWETRLLATSRRPIYVVMMSSQYDQRSLIEALDSGADDFIGKPPLAEELYARLRAAERLACSLGVGEGKAGDTVDQILARADAARYDAKLKGRNCVVGINARVPMRNAVVTEGIARALAM
jgi:PleD family two-component response regulator